MQSTKCQCGLPKGGYTPGCPACERREKKAISQRRRRHGANAAGTTLDALTATALMHGWHVVNDDLVGFDAAWEHLTGRQQGALFPVAADRLAQSVRTLTDLLAGVLANPHLVAEGETAAECWARQASGQARGH